MPKVQGTIFRQFERHLAQLIIKEFLHNQLLMFYRNQSDEIVYKAKILCYINFFC